jgi:hypothetical protein
MAATNIGMMDGAYFVGRNEILSWINSTLSLNLNKVEEVCFVPLLDFQDSEFPFSILLASSRGRKKDYGRRGG